MIKTITNQENLEVLEAMAEDLEVVDHKFNAVILADGTKAAKEKAEKVMKNVKKAMKIDY